MSSPEVVFERITSRGGDAIAQLIRIYQSSIEPSEQKPSEALQGAIQDERYRLWLARLDREGIGFSISFLPDGADFWLLEYMAVAAPVRSAGHGRGLFQNAAADAFVLGRKTGLLEVDAVTGEGAAREQKRRRLAFYAGLGCRMVAGLDYILPLDVAGAPPAMTLLVHGADGQATLPKAQLRAWLRALYSQVYAQPLDDPRIDAMTAHLPDDIALAAIS